MPGPRPAARSPPARPRARGGGPSRRGRGEAWRTPPDAPGASRRCAARPRVPLRGPPAPRARPAAPGISARRGASWKPAAGPDGALDSSSVRARRLRRTPCRAGGGRARGAAHGRDGIPGTPSPFTGTAGMSRSPRVPVDGTGPGGRLGRRRRRRRDGARTARSCPEVAAGGQRPVRRARTAPTARTAGSRASTTACPGVPPSSASSARTADPTGRPDPRGRTSPGTSRFREEGERGAAGRAPTTGARRPDRAGATAPHRGA